MTDQKRDTAIFINGGAGRVICSIPALEKFAEENPDDNFIIVCEGGTDFYKGHKFHYIFPANLAYFDYLLQMDRCYN